MPDLSGNAAKRDELEALYREVVLEHYRNPRHRSALAHPSADARVTNPICGDQVHVEVELADGRIADVSARARGCSIAVASGSVMTELVLDPRLRAFGRVAELPSRQRCATLAWEALTEALGAP